MWAVGTLHVLRRYSYKVILVIKNNELTLIYYKAEEMGIFTKFVNARSQEKNMCHELGGHKGSGESPFSPHSGTSAGTRKDNPRTQKFCLESPAMPSHTGLASFRPGVHVAGTVYTWGSKSLVADSCSTVSSVSGFRPVTSTGPCLPPQLGQPNVCRHS